MAAHKGESQFFRIDLFNPVCVGLINTGIAVYFVKIIHAQAVVRRFILYDIMFPENPPDCLLYLYFLKFFDNKYIHLQRLFAQQVFFMHLQILHLMMLNDADE